MEPRVQGSLDFLLRVSAKKISMLFGRLAIHIEIFPPGTITSIASYNFRSSKDYGTNHSPARE